MLKKILYLLLALILLPVVIYLLGPRPNYPNVDFTVSPINLPLDQLDQWLKKKELGIPNLKPNNESRIIWADSLRTKTAYSIVYLHGFSASPMESDPVHLNFAKKFGMNMYIPRLAQHGIKNKEIFLDLTPKMLIDSAKEALALGQILGEKVIIMSCSTGSTLAIPIAAKNPALVEAHIMLSPNFALYDSKAKLLTGPWGKQLAQKIQGSKYRQLSMPKKCHGYWTMEYRLEGVIALQALIEECIKPIYFEQIEDPIFIGYYYKDKTKQDKIISIPAIHKHMEQVKTPHQKIQMEAFPDVNTHVIASSLQSNDISSVEKKLEEFAKQVLHISSK